MLPKSQGNVQTSWKTASVMTTVTIDNSFQVPIQKRQFMLLCKNNHVRLSDKIILCTKEACFLCPRWGLPVQTSHNDPFQWHWRKRLTRKCSSLFHTNFHTRCGCNSQYIQITTSLVDHQWKVILWFSSSLLLSYSVFWKFPFAHWWLSLSQHK